MREKFFGVTAMSAKATATVAGHNVFVQANVTGVNRVTVAVSVYHRKGQEVSIKCGLSDDMYVISDDWDLPSGSFRVSVHSDHYIGLIHIIRTILAGLHVQVRVNFDAKEDRVNYELFTALMQNPLM